MSELTSLVDRGSAWIEGQVPRVIRINGGPPLLATVDFVGKRDAFADQSRQREVNFDCTVMVRKVYLRDVPPLGANVLLDGVTYRVFETRDDETSITLLLNSPQK